MNLKSFSYAFDGLKDLCSGRHKNAMFHLFFTAIVLVLSFLFSLSKEEFLWIILWISLVLAAEAFNTAIEYITDLASPDIHPLAKKTKDMSAAAVLLISFGAFICGIIIFIPKIYTLLAYA